MAEQSRNFGDYVVHYSAFTTDTLSPEVAKSYRIQRSKNRILLNISVLKSGDAGIGTPVKTRINGTATNLSQQLREMELREINEDGAIYYIATAPVNHEETLTFDFNITPAGENKPFRLTFQQQFFTE